MAYVIYFDRKGVLRKEKSWESWRSKDIAPVEFDNVPTSGFVLNKKVGDYKSDWNHRKAHIRVYDPRNFEFEISVENLLFILEECSAIKGKGLEGDFVYAWSGTELVLLPVSSQDYQQSQQHGANQLKKVSKTDIKEGCVYRTKDGERVLYLGRHEWRTRKWDRSGYYQFSVSKQHIFVLIDKTEEQVKYSDTKRYWLQSGFTKLAERLSEEPDPSFAAEYDTFKASAFSSPPIELVGTKVALTDVEFTRYADDVRCSRHYIRDIDGSNTFYKVAIAKVTRKEYGPDKGYYGYYNGYTEVVVPDQYYLAGNGEGITFQNGKIVHIPLHPTQERRPTFTMQQLASEDFYTISVRHANGAITPMPTY